YEVDIRIADDGDLLIVERIDYDFGDAERHGIFRTIPSRFYVDQVHDRVMPVEDVSAESPTAPADVDVSTEGGVTSIRIGDEDVEITGRHRYTIRYRVEGALNGFDDHDELFWNAVGVEWDVPIDRASATVTAPAPIRRVTCYQGWERSTEACGRARAEGGTARFAAGRPLGPYAGLTVVVAIPKGVVPEPRPILVERWSAARAFSVTPATVGGAAALLAIVVAALAGLWMREGRDRRYVGSPIDQVMGSAGGAEEVVPLGEGDAEAPVEFAPPEEVRPGQIGTLIDERANVVDVTATIVDLATRGYLVIEELPDTGLFSKVDWRLARSARSDEDLLPYERKLLKGLFRDGPEVTVSSLKTTFAERLHGVQEDLYADLMRRRWFRARPDTVRTRWAAIGMGVVVAGAALTFVLARWTHWGIVAIPVVLGGIALGVLAGRMPSRTAAGTAMLRRVRGFRRVIATAETHMSRWAEQENVFTRFLPYAVVFGLTEKWAKAFEDLGLTPDTSSWYVGTRAFTAASLGDSISSFSVRTGGTLASTPASSGSSGFGGGGSSGGGGGGGGGGSW
ncbi:MAG TPA: DUF2207 domain-containing protein, partial [Actinomycetota bacterium]|nr:DUF2207 domain-containing protein [Actinomycetota bacterium]